MRNRPNSRCTLQLVHSNRCSNHNLGSSSWRKIIVVISDFPINFCFTFFSLFLYSVLKVLGWLRPPHRRTLRVLPPPAKEINPCCGWLERCLTPLQAMPAVVGSNGLEPSTSRLSGVRSNHLSYEPISVAVRLPSGQTFASAFSASLTPRSPTSSLDVVSPRCASAAPPWWRRTESNCRPPACKAGALPAELRPRMRFVPG